MSSVASQLLEEVTAHAQSDSLEDAQDICAGGTYFPNNLRILLLAIACQTYQIFVPSVCSLLQLLKIDCTQAKNTLIV